MSVLIWPGMCGVFFFFFFFRGIVLGKDKFGVLFRSSSFSRERRLRVMNSGRLVDLGRPLR